MALSFPINPTTGQIYNSGSSAIYEWTGDRWVVEQPQSTAVLSASYATSASHLIGYEPVVLSAGPGIDINGYQISASLLTVNGMYPDANGNIATGLVAVLTGPSASLVSSASGDITGSLTEGTVWVVSGDPTPSNNGLNWIYDVNPSGVGEWLVLSKQQFITSSVTSASLAQTVNGTTGQLLGFDNRTISPSEMTASYLQYGFTSWANNNSSPYADYLHMRSWEDASAGNDNLVMFRKDAIGVRVYQQAFGSPTAYSTFKDLAFTDASNASGNWPTASHAITASYLNGTFGTVPTVIHAQNTSGQTIANNQVPSTIVTNWTNILAQNASEWNAATGVFTAAKAGVYSVSATLTYAPKTAAAFGNQVNVVIGKNRGYQAVSANFAETGNAVRRGTVSATACISLAVGETITIETYHDLGSAASLDTAGWLNTITIQEIASRITD